MARTILVLLFLVVAGSLMGSASTPPVSFAASSPHTLLAVVTLNANPIEAGEALSMTARLNKAPGSPTVLRLLITYADGQEQTETASTVSDETTLLAQIPANALPGRATFALSTSGCGCGDHAIGQPSVTTESTITGWFLVR